MNIYQRINEVRKAIGYVQKDKSVSTGGGSYKAVTHDAVTGMIRAELIKQGIVILPPSVVSATFHPKEPESKQRLYEATYSIEFVNMDEPTDKFSVMQNAHALDNGDKAPGKAISYAAKYAILKLFNIETGDDEESRYQQDSFNLVANVNAIKASDTQEDVKARYEEAIVLTNDRGEQKALIAAAQATKARINKLSEKPA